MNLIHRFFSSPAQSFFLFGPRGTGKSTWLKQRFQDAIWVDLLDLSVLRQYEAHPERLRNLIEAYPEKSSVVIDEIQKIPALLSMVHSLIEEKGNLQFIMTGSSSRKLRRAGVNLLGGRAFLKHMHPFIATEKSAFQ